jgi:hypothetical protein
MKIINCKPQCCSFSKDKLRKIVSFMVTCMGSQLFYAIPKKTRTHATARYEKN